MTSALTLQARSGQWNRTVFKGNPPRPGSPPDPLGQQIAADPPCGQHEHDRPANPYGQRRPSDPPAPAQDHCLAKNDNRGRRDPQQDHHRVQPPGCRRVSLQEMMDAASGSTARAVQTGRLPPQTRRRPGDVVGVPHRQDHDHNRACPQQRPSGKTPPGPGRDAAVRLR